jgi:hypothetical protein
MLRQAKLATNCSNKLFFMTDSQLRLGSKGVGTCEESVSTNFTTIFPLLLGGDIAMYIQMIVLSNLDYAY